MYFKNALKTPISACLRSHDARFLEIPFFVVACGRFSIDSIVQYTRQRTADINGISGWTPKYIGQDETKLC